MGQPMSRTATPRTEGCRWPAEWEPHAATWIAWPHRERTWPGHFQPIPRCFALIAETLAQFELVHVLAGRESVMAEARAMVGHLDRVVLHDIPTNDAWVRDYGPIFLTGPGAGEVSLVDWHYNAWGGKYPPWDLDNAVPRLLANVLQLRRFEPGIVLEGGSIDTNGQGLILTTESCLLDPRRNPHLRREDIEAALLDYCAASEVIWLAGGPLAGDDTDGHVDQLARFVSPHQVVAAVEQDPARRKLCSATGKPRATAGDPEAATQSAPGSDSAPHAAPHLDRFSACARQLLQLLHRQRLRARAALRRSRG